MEAVYWLIAVAVFLIIEMITLGMTTIWFSGGALAAAIAAVLGAGIWLQIIVFIVVTILLFIFTRPWAVKHLNNRTIKTNAESIIGKEVFVIEEINNRKPSGKVRMGDLEWTARSKEDDEVFLPEEKVIVGEIRGVKMIVSAIKSN